MREEQEVVYPLYLGRCLGKREATGETCVASQSLLLLLFSRSVEPDSATHELQRARLLSFPISRSLLKLMSIALVMPSNHLILCHPILLPSTFPSMGVFSSESVLHIRWPKYWGSCVLM